MNPILIFAAALTGPAAGPVPGNPQSWVGNADYPAAAFRAGEQGIVEFTLDVGADGKVTGCTVTASSGSATLDGATCELMRERARFAPARDTRGRPVAGTWSSRMNWRLPEDEEGPPVGVLTSRLDVTATGKVAACAAALDGRPGASSEVCRRVKAGNPPDWIRSYAGAYRRLWLRELILPGQASAPPADRAWGRRIAERISVLEAGEGDSIIACGMLAASGPPAAGEDFCTENRGLIEPGASRHDAASRSMVIGWSLYGIPRR